MTQDDVLFTHLTVKETLTYAALLRLPRTMTRQQKKERAMDIIYELGLERYTVDLLHLLHCGMFTVLTKWLHLLCSKVPGHNDRRIFCAWGFRG